MIEEVKLLVYSILSHLNLNSNMGLVATLLVQSDTVIDGDN